MCQPPMRFRPVRRRLKRLFWTLLDRVRKPRARPVPMDHFAAYDAPAYLRGRRRGQR